VPTEPPDPSIDPPIGPRPLPAAVLWDLDGTLVDTEPSWMAAEYALAERHGATWTHADALSLVGNDLRTTGRLIVEGMGLPLSVDEVVDELVPAVVASIERELVVRPGARELLTALQEAGVPCGLVTMSYEPIARAVVDVLGDDVFAAVVTGDSVRHGKPHPEPYLTAAAMLGVAPADCTAIEDSPPGPPQPTPPGAGSSWCRTWSTWKPGRNGPSWRRWPASRSTTWRRARWRLGNDPLRGRVLCCLPPVMRA
jgi:beta-phosphoglucomutase-like phosphatase (HAD superfamily)